MSAGRVLQAYAFIDGAYLRAERKNVAVPFPNPRMVVLWVVDAVQNIGGRVLLRRTS